MALSQVKIINLALTNLGTKAQIESLDDGSTEAGIASSVWTPTLEMVLASFPWSFATRFEALALVSDYTVPSEWTYAYRYPSLCLRALRIVSSAGRMTDPPIPFVIASDGSSGRVILSDEPDAVLAYTSKTTDPTAFDASFTYALSWALAAAFAIPLTENPRLRAEVWKIYQDSLDDARRSVANEYGQDVISTSRLIRSRE